jgi:hypothetical protein
LDEEKRDGVHGFPDPQKRGISTPRTKTCPWGPRTGGTLWQSWYIRYPHPYFGRKILVFMRLQGGLRCKIVKTKEFPAKSSRIRSYGTFWPLLAEKRREKDALDDV